MIRYKPKDYAEALLDALIKRPQKEVWILRNFSKTLVSHRDFSKWRKIVEIFEELYILQFRKKVIDVYSARDTKRYRNQVFGTVPRGARVEFHQDSTLIGGLKILINKEILIDGSVGRRISKLFAR